MSKSLGYYTYTGVQEVSAGGMLPLTNVVRQYGRNVRLNNNKVIVSGQCNDPVAGYYNVHVNATLTASAEGTVTVSLFQDGDLVQGAVQTSSAAENGIVNFGFTAPVRVFCGQSQSTLALYVNGQQVNTMNVSMEVVRE